jgi:hypothetical protein
MINIPYSNQDRVCEIYATKDYFYSLYYDFGTHVLLSHGSEYYNE